MAQHDLILDNGSGAAFRADANNALAALGSTMKGPNTPPAPVAGMQWMDDDTPSSSVWTWKVYDGADWLTIGAFDISANSFLLRAGAGSAASPAFSFAGDPDTGIFSPGANQLAFSLGGVEALRFTGGNVGIGTNAPTYRLVVANNETDGGWIYSSGPSSFLGLGSYSSASSGAASLAFDRSVGTLAIRNGARDAQVDRFLLDNNGNVGIGTTAPTYRLVVANSDTDGGWMYSSGPSSFLGLGCYNSSSSGAASFEFNRSSGMLAIRNGTRDAQVNRLTVDAAGVISLYGNVVASGDMYFNSGYGSAALAFGCRAWVNFNGTGTVAIRASGNVSSITDNGTGDYTVNFTTAMPDANYVMAGTGEDTDSTGDVLIGRANGATKSTSACRIKTLNGENVATDYPSVELIFVR
jgi:hypothetical protein